MRLTQTSANATATMSPEEIVRAAWCDAICDWLTMHGQATRSYGRGRLPWDGGVFRGRNLQPAWPKLVQSLARIDSTPGVAIRTVFAAHQSSKMPYPNLLLNDEIVFGIDNRVRSDREQLRYRVGAEIQAFRLEVDFQLATNVFPDEVAASIFAATWDGTQTSPLFRALILSRLQAPIEAGLRRRANWQYLKYRHLYYDEWSQLFSGGVYDFAPEFFDTRCDAAERNAPVRSGAFLPAAI